MRRFDAEYVALKKLITEGGLGNPLMLHCTHRNQMVGDHFNSEFMIRDSVVHEVDVARFLLDEELASVQVIKGAATSIAPAGTADPMLVVFETESGRLVTDEIYVRSQVGYEVRAEVVGERGSALIGLDQNLQVKTTDGRWGGTITPGFVERFRRRVRPRAAALGRRGPGGHHRRAGSLGRVRRGRGLRGRRTGGPHRSEGAVHLQPRPGPELAPEHGLDLGGITGPDLEDGPAMKLALDPQMFFATSSVYELPDIVARLGYDWMELSPKADFIPFFKLSAGRRRRGAEAEEDRRPMPGWGSPRCCRCSAGRVRTRISGRRRSGPGSG